MSALTASLKQWGAGYVAAWDRFWFAPRLPHTLCILRIIAGSMLLYSHLVLATDLTSFLGETAWINNETALKLHDGSFFDADAARSYLWHIDSAGLLWAHHALTILVTAMFAAGLLTRITVPLAFFFQLMYLHRLTGHLFGLDQIVTYSTMYLMLSPCGSCLSVDAVLRKKLASKLSDKRWFRILFPDDSPSVGANVATRLLQLHLCVIYLFGGLSKARGQTWWDGTAVWYSVGNYEYQSMNMTWMAHYPWLFSAMTHATLFWEVFYCALVWPRLTRPIVLAVAVAVHGGIALFLGMITFGLMMIGANMIFVSPDWIAAKLGRRQSEETPEASAEPEDVSEVTTDAQKAQQQSEGSTSERSLTEREERVRKASRRVKEKSRRLKEREQKYRQRVERLKKREEKIKRLVERRRKAKEARSKPK